MKILKRIISILIAIIIIAISIFFYVWNQETSEIFSKNWDNIYNGSLRVTTSNYKNLTYDLKPYEFESDFLIFFKNYADSICKDSEEKKSLSRQVKLLNNMIVKDVVIPATKDVNLYTKDSFFYNLVKNFSKEILIIRSIDIENILGNNSELIVVDPDKRTKITIEKNDFFNETQRITIIRDYCLLSYNVRLSSLLTRNNFLLKNIYIPIPFHLYQERSLTYSLVRPDFSLQLYALRHAQISSKVKDIIISFVLQDQAFVVNRFRSYYIFFIPNINYLFLHAYDNSEVSDQKIPSYYHPVYLKVYKLFLDSVILKNLEDYNKKGISHFAIGKIVKTDYLHPEYKINFIKKN